MSIDLLEKDKKVWYNRRGAQGAARNYDCPMGKLCSYVAHVRFASSVLCTYTHLTVSRYVAICTRSLTSELADSLRLIIVWLAAPSYKMLRIVMMSYDKFWLVGQSYHNFHVVKS